MNKMIMYYVQGHTGKGYVNYIQNNIQRINRIILLKSEEAIVVTAVLKELMKEYEDEEIEVIKSIESKDLIEGIIIRRMSLAILHERIYSSHHKNVVTVPVQIDTEIDELFVSTSKEHSSSYGKAYKHFAKGLEIHEQLEKIYIEEMNFKKADQIIENLLNLLFANVNHSERKSMVYERLFGTNTPDGIVNTIPNLIEPIQHKIFILGRAGTGKSYLMNKVLEKCIELGIDVELYRCSLDPHSIDMLIIRELDVCIHDNTSPHIVSMDYDNIQIIDMYKETVNQTTEKDNESTIQHFQDLYKEQMQTGLRCLQKHQIKVAHIINNLGNVDFTHIIKKVLKNS